jgi:hypothetical protein
MTLLVYQYGLLPPTKLEEDVDQQMLLAHRYGNALVEIERRRRDTRDAILSRSGLAPYDERIATLETRLAALRTTASASRAKGRARAGDPVSIGLIRDVREDLKIARAERKAARAEATARAAPELAQLQGDTAAEIRSARAASGVYWGTYLQVEQAAFQARGSMAPPRFHPWRGDGAVSVQIIKGMPAGSLMDGTDRRVRLSIERSPVPGRGGQPLPRLMLRIGSIGIEPVWAEWPVIIDRPLPLEARVKWAKVVRRRVASRYQWSLLLTLEGVGRREECGEGSVALDLRWRQVEDSDGQATTLAGVWSDGTESGEIHCPQRVLRALSKVASLRSIRDKHLEPVRAALVAWRDATSDDTHRERMRNVGQWHAAGRFAALALWWRERRIKGDEDIYDYLEAWRRRDKHLWEWEANARQSALLHRREVYRIAAATLARRYGTIVLETLDLAALAREPAPEDGAKTEGRAGREQRTATAPSVLRTAVTQAFQRRGGGIIEVPPCAGPQRMLEAVERSGVAKKSAPARSNRFNRLRGLDSDGGSGSQSKSEPLAAAPAKDRAIA